EKIGHALVEEGRLAIGTQPPQMAGHHVDELRQLPLPFTQRRFRFLIDIDVDTDPVPSSDAALNVIRRADRKSMPDPFPGRSQHAPFMMKMLTRPQAMPQRSGHAFVVFRVYASLPAEIAAVEKALFA